MNTNTNYVEQSSEKHDVIQFQHATSFNSQNMQCVQKHGSLTAMSILQKSNHVLGNMD